MDALQKLKSEKAKILADAQARAEEIDRDMARLQEMEGLAVKYGLVVVDKGQVIQASAEAPIVRVFTRGPVTTEGVTMTVPAIAASASPLRSSPSQQTLAIQAAEEILLASPEPLKLEELYQRVAARGVRLGGQRPQSTLSAYLSHSNKICSVRKGWWGVMPPWSPAMSEPV